MTEAFPGLPYRLLAGNMRAAARKNKNKKSLKKLLTNGKDCSNISIVPRDTQEQGTKKMRQWLSW